MVSNLSFFDEALHSDLESLRDTDDVSMEGNAYASAVGFLAADEQDSRISGLEMIRALRQRYEQRQAISLAPREIEAILGAVNLDTDWFAEFESLSCVARVDMDCSERLIEEVARVGALNPRLSLLLERYERMLGEPRFEEAQERDITTPFPPFRFIRAAARIRLAASYRDDTNAEFLEKAADDLAFWTRILRDGEALATKMVSLAGIQDNLTFLSTFVRNRSPDASELETLTAFVRPFTEDESDIGEAFVSEARIAVLSEPHPMLYGLPWPLRLLTQENATRNEEYQTVFVPVRIRASLSAGEYFDQRAYEPIPYELNAFPPPIFNLGGKLARRAAWADVQTYLARVHDQNGRISLVLLQAEIAQTPNTPVNDIVRSSTHRNPYTDEPMRYDPQARAVGFDCMQPIFHPPALPDTCSFQIERGGEMAKTERPRDDSR